MAIHSSVLAWRIPGMGEPGGLPSLGSHRVGHDGSDLAAAAAAASTLSLSISYSVILHLYLIYGSCIPVKESPQWRVERSSGIQCGARKVRRIIPKMSIYLPGYCFIFLKKSIRPCSTSIFFFSPQTMLSMRTEYCNPMDYSPPGSSVHGILQA